MKLKANTKKYVFKDFNEYAVMMKISASHPNYEAYKIIWDMARTPELSVEKEKKAKKK